MAPENGNAEIFFAKKLANNDKKVRDKALKKLKTWLTNKGKSTNGLSEDELLKIWKGLFYCMWFSDKPLVQEELAENLAATIHSFKPTSTGVLFSKVFFVTMGREWLGIDKLRLDKFYLLVKKFITGLLQYLCDVDWDDSIVTETSQFLEEILSNQKYPDGMKIYVSEYIIPILTDVCSTTKNIPSDEVFVLLMKPFFAALAEPQSFTVHKIIEEEILKPLLQLKIKNDTDKLYKVPFETLAEYLCQLGAKKEMQTKTRKLLFSYTNSYRKHAEDLKSTKQKTKKRKKASSKNKNIEDKTEDGAVVARKKKKVTNGHSSTDEDRHTTEESGISEEENQLTTDVVNGDQGHAEEQNTVKNSVKTTGKVKQTGTGIKKKKGKNLTSDIEKLLHGDAEGITELSSNAEETLETEEDHVKQTLQFLDSENEKDSCSNNQEDNKKESKLDKKRRKTLPSKTEAASEQESLKKKKKIRKSLPSVALSSQSDDSGKETNNEEPLVNFVNGPPPLPKVNQSKKKRRKTMGDEDQPKPVIQFIKTQSPPKAFVRRQPTAKTEPRPKKKVVLAGKQASAATPKTEPRRKSVRIDMSKNKSISDIELKVSPLPAFNPDRKPSKGVLKTPVRAMTPNRPKATDYF